jgi:hypothetical protein
MNGGHTVRRPCGSPGVLGEEGGDVGGDLVWVLPIDGMRRVQDFGSHGSEAGRSR